jgi:hypothetical protein
VLKRHGHATASSQPLKKMETHSLSTRSWHGDSVTGITCDTCALSCERTKVGGACSRGPKLFTKKDFQRMQGGVMSLEEDKEKYQDNDIHNESSSVVSELSMELDGLDVDNSSDNTAQERHPNSLINNGNKKSLSNILNSEGSGGGRDRARKMFYSVVARQEIEDKKESTLFKFATTIICYGIVSVWYAKVFLSVDDY